MLTNHTTVTVFCSKQIGREKLWMRHIIEGVNFHGTDQLLIADMEVKRSDEYVIRIPADMLKQYIDSVTWKALSAEDSENYFTLKKGDYIVKGSIETDVKSSADIIENFEAYKIVQVTENLSASKYSQHIKLVVK